MTHFADIKFLFSQEGETLSGFHRNSKILN